VIPAIHHIPVGGAVVRPEDGGTMLAHAAAALYVVVRLYDVQGVPPETVAAARATTAQILRNADIDLRWARCPCPRPVGPVELMIRLAASTAQSEPLSLGFSYVDVQKQAGTLATVFSDRVHALAVASRVDESELLGRAMAHEIGHLLLGTHDHAARGLMRGKWTSIELQKNQGFDWQLTGDDGASIRRALNRRIRGVREARLMAAAR
jgi:hypothetical protein